MKRDVFGFLDYKAYIKHWVNHLEVRGSRAKMAESIGCGSSFVSQVLNGHVDFSLEQGIKLNRFLEHDREESHYFLLLLQASRAGSGDLKAYFLEQIQSIRERRKVIQERIGVHQTLTLEDQMTYYSSWVYAAVHVLTAIPGFQSKSEIASALGLASPQISAILEFLVGKDLVRREGQKYLIGQGRIHLGKNSPMLGRHHANWRMQALKSLDQLHGEGTHFSVAMAISNEDVEAIRSILLQALERTERVIQDAKEQTLYCMGIDFFRLV